MADGLNVSIAATNSTENSCPAIGNSGTSKIIKTVFYIIILVVSLFGNSLVMLVVQKTHVMRTTINYFIFNMAASDFLFTVFVITRRIVEIFSKPRRWFLDGTLGSVSCKLNYFIQDVCTAVSLLTLVAIGVERYCAVVFPMRSGLISSKLRRLMVLFVWVIACGFHSPYFYAFRLTAISNETFCIYTWKPHFKVPETHTRYFLASSTMLFILPLLAIAVIYTKIIWTLKRREIPGNSGSFQLRQYRQRRNRRVLKMVITVLLAFLVCWLPFNICVYLIFFDWQTNVPCYQNLIVTCILFLAYSNAAINPFIYFIFSENFRIGAVKLLKWKLLGDRNNTNSSRRSGPASLIKIRTLRFQLESTMAGETFSIGSGRLSVELRKFELGEHALYETNDDDLRTTKM